MKNPSKVYFRRITDNPGNDALDLFERLLEDEKIKLEKEIPIKVHFGNEDNTTYIPAKEYTPLIEFLKKKKIKSSFIETNVVYKGKRSNKENHIALAKEHGFTQIPIIIADGEKGEAYDVIEIGKKHLKSCKIGKEFKRFKQIIVTSHFKGHTVAGFGGAIKQLSMGFAARGGKLDMHSNSHPLLNPFKCKKCMECVKHCPVDAIDISKLIQKVDHKKCIGCAMCIEVCPYGAMTLNWMGSVGDKFREKLTEYAYAATLGKSNIYITFAMNITKNCDCMAGGPIVAEDVGIFASTDPVAIDSACLNVVNKNKKVFSGHHQLEYAEKLGMGSMDYELIEI